MIDLKLEKIKEAGIEDLLFIVEDLKKLLGEDITTKWSDSIASPTLFVKMKINDQEKAKYINAFYHNNKISKSVDVFVNHKGDTILFWVKASLCGFLTRAQFCKKYKLGNTAIDILTLRDRLEIIHIGKRLRIFRYTKSALTKRIAKLKKIEETTK